MQVAPELRSASGLLIRRAIPVTSLNGAGILDRTVNGRPFATLVPLSDSAASVAITHGTD